MKSARTVLKRLRLKTGLSLGQAAKTIGWPKSSYVMYEEAYAKPLLPERLAHQLVPVFEFFGIHRAEFRDLFAKEIALGAQAIPPLVLSLDPRTPEGAARIKVLRAVRAARSRRGRRSQLALLWNNHIQFDFPGDNRDLVEFRGPEDEVLGPVTIDVLPSQPLESGDFTIDFREPTSQQTIPPHLWNLRGLYAVRVHGETAFRLVTRDGDFVLAAPLDIEPEDRVIVTSRSGEACSSTIGFVISATSRDIEIRKIGTQQSRLISMGSVERVDRIFTNNELVGWY
jgi:DNA-binding XRE family transcriptional regulator